MCTHVPVLNLKYTNDIGYFFVLKTNMAIWNELQKMEVPKIILNGGSFCHAGCWQHMDVLSERYGQWRLSRRVFSSYNVNGKSCLENMSSIEIILNAWFCLQIKRLKWCLKRRFWAEIKFQVWVSGDGEELESWNFLPSLSAKLWLSVARPWCTQTRM